MMQQEPEKLPFAPTAKVSHSLAGQLKLFFNGIQASPGHMGGKKKKILIIAMHLIDWICSLLQ